MTKGLLPIAGRVRQVGWVRVGHGVFRRAEPAADGDPRAVLEAWQLVLPVTACFTHLSSARARGWQLPPLPDDLPVLVAALRGDGSTRRQELRWARHAHPPAYDVVDGLRLSTAAETILACARDLCLLDLVVVIDSALQLGACTMAELDALAGLHRRGAPLLRLALTLVDGRSESVYETLLRMLHVVCGIEVEPQHELHDAAGRFVARGDLWLVGTRTLHEYDGADHLKRKRQQKDLRRTRRIDDTSWTRRGYTSNDVLQRGVTVLRDADASVGREHRPERIRAWNELLRESSFTPAGLARLSARLVPGGKKVGVATSPGTPEVS